MRLFKLLVTICIYFLAAENCYSQSRWVVDKLMYRPGISIEKNFIDPKSFDLGFNVIASRGRLTNDIINYYGAEATYKWIRLEDKNSDGFCLKASYQRVNYPIGINVNFSTLLSHPTIYVLPETGINLFGVASVNYGYYFSSGKSYDPSFHSLTLKLSLNIIYINYLNIVSRSEKWRFKTRHSNSTMN